MKITEPERTLCLAGAIAKVVQGLRDGSVTAKPMLDLSNEEAEELPIITLEQMLTETLAECGILLVDPEPPSSLRRRRRINSRS